MNNTPWSKAIDEILNNYALEVYKFKLYEPSAEWDAEKFKATTAINQAVREHVIGKRKELVVTYSHSDFENGYIQGRNDLREEQRKIIGGRE